MCQLCVHTFGAKEKYGHIWGAKATYAHMGGSRAGDHVYANMSSNRSGNAPFICPCNRACLYAYGNMRSNCSRRFQYTPRCLQGPSKTLARRFYLFISCLHKIYPPSIQHLSKSCARLQNIRTNTVFTDDTRFPIHAYRRLERCTQRIYTQCMRERF